MPPRILYLPFLPLLAALPAEAQLRLEPGSADYGVEGWWEGDAMEPWQAQILVRDTTFEDGSAASLITYNSRRAYPGWVFTSTAVVREEPMASPLAHWEGNGRRGPSWCDAVVGPDGRILVRDAYGERASEANAGIVIPDFTVAPVVAAMDLAEGGTVRLTPYRCDANPVDPAPILTWDMVATVSSGTHAREGGQPEPVWVVSDRGGYPIELIIAKSDRRVLRVTTYPAGSGRMVETLSRD